MCSSDLVTKRLTVLIVDDDVVAACTIAKQLRGRHEVRIALGAYEALDEVFRRPPDVVVCVLDVPYFPSDALLAMIASERPATRRVLCASRGADWQQRMISTEIAHSVLAKPAPIEALLEAIEVQG